MFKQRNVRRSAKFSSRIRGSVRHRREYAASVYSTAGIQFALSIVLFLAAYHSYRAIVNHTNELPFFAQIAIPVFFGIAGVIAARLSVTKVMYARSLWSGDPDDDDAE